MLHNSYNPTLICCYNYENVQKDTSIEFFSATANYLNRVGVKIKPTLVKNRTAASQRTKTERENVYYSETPAFSR